MDADAAWVNARRSMVDTLGTVFVVDDDLSIRQALEGLLRSVGWQVETFANADAFLRRPAFDGPSCLVLDVQLPDLDGLALQQRLSAVHERMPIIFITGHGDVPTSVRAMKAGAIDFLLKPFDEGALLDAIRKALELHAESRKESASLEQLRLRHEGLTERQREVMELVVQGMPNKQIAGELEITEVTVKIHRGRMMRAMGAASLADLVRMAQRLASGESRAAPQSHDGER